VEDSDLRDVSGVPLAVTAPIRLSAQREFLPAVPIGNLAAELFANRALLAALAGPGIVLTADACGCALPVRLTAEDFTRVLVNVVKNAAEAMPHGGRIHLSLAEPKEEKGTLTCVALTIEDNGPGFSEQALEKVFTPSYSGEAEDTRLRAGWPHTRRGLGLAISRSIIEGAGGRIVASNREQGGARISVELPIRHSRRTR
jgi:signal transduction histidine kinase